ncbi:MAG TPA: alpha/beta fold hydrolase [Candidatus Paceibacterota bacterium]
MENADPEKTPIIIIPGIMGKWGFMKWMGDRISRQGYPVYVIPELGYNMSSIPLSAEILDSVVVRVEPEDMPLHQHIHHSAHAVKQLVEKHDLKGAIIVAHSKGGLIGKYLLTHFNEGKRILGMIAIASPFSGSEMAKLVPYAPFTELEEESPVIQDLEKHHRINKKIVSIMPEYDNHVWAKEGSYLDGALNIQVPVKGHHKVVFSNVVFDAVLHSIESITNKAGLEEAADTYSVAGAALSH